jgi:transposase
MNTPDSSDSRAVRVQRPERRQIAWQPLALDQMVAGDHRVRVVWRYAESLDLSPLYAKIRAVEGQAGRNAVDPRILLALWMFATIEGVSSARELDRLCERDVPYLWICGGVGVNYHLLSDFRTAHGDFLDQLLTQTIGTLLHQGLVTLEEVAQDGLRVRANAGASSFRRQPTLQECLKQARQQIERLNAEREQEADPNTSHTRRAAARERAAAEREQRIEQALEELAQLQEQREQRKAGSGKDTRASTTDPEARNMKMPCGGYRPAYNVQLATAGDTRLIVGVDVTNSGSDRGQMAPLYEQLRDRYGQVPRRYLVDCGFNTKEDITQLEQSGTQVYVPPYQEKETKAKGLDPYARKRHDNDETFAARQRMGTEAGKAIYKQRPSIAEYPNAEFRNRGLQQFRVRGLAKVRAIALWHALTFNLMRLMTLKLVT